MTQAIRASSLRGSPLPRWLASLRKLANAVGLDVVRYQVRADEELFPDVAKEDLATLMAVRPFTMTSPERVLALCQAVRYVIAAQVPGGVVECGVWRGGSMMAVARTLIAVGDASRDLYLFDTFEGMTPPGELDVSISGEKANELLGKGEKSEEDLVWCYAPLEGVRSRIATSGYPEHRVHLVKGSVEETIPAHAPESIAVLRLDTDWYESTKHELTHLFPRLVVGGVLIIDDYGHWEGARRAVDEYFAEKNIKLLLNRIDYSGRIAVKTAA